jgi:hypothetical protein
MSHYIVIDKDTKYVFGWDQPLRSFFLQIHDLTLPEDDRITTWLGASQDTIMYETDDLVLAAHKRGYDIPYETRVKLYGDKDAGI